MSLNLTMRSLRLPCAPRPRFRPLVLTLVMAAGLQAPALAGDLAAGRSKAKTLCGNCHGLDGVALLPGAANLGGQPQEYLREQLRAFRDGRRQNPQMSFIAKPLSDADIDDVASWYAAIKVRFELPP
jgi:cytochrome c553